LFKKTGANPINILSYKMNSQKGKEMLQKRKNLIRIFGHFTLSCLSGPFLDTKLSLQALFCTALSKGVKHLIGFATV
jgi:hypothetical protein